MSLRVRIPLIAGLLIAIAAFLGTPHRAAAQNPDDELASAPRITMDDFKKLMASDGVVIVDVRGPDQYREGHLPGAISIPLDKLSARTAELKGFKKPIVTYCA